MPRLRSLSRWWSRRHVWATDRLSWPLSSWVILSISHLTVGVPGLQVCAPTSGFCGLWGLSSGHQAWVASAYPCEPSLGLFIVILMIKVNAHQTKLSHSKGTASASSLTKGFCVNTHLPSCKQLEKHHSEGGGSDSHSLTTMNIN